MPGFHRDEQFYHFVEKASSISANKIYLQRRKDKIRLKIPKTSSVYLLLPIGTRHKQGTTLICVFSEHKVLFAHLQKMPQCRSNYMTNQIHNASSLCGKQGTFFESYFLFHSSLCQLHGAIFSAHWPGTHREPCMFLRRKGM